MKIALIASLLAVSLAGCAVSTPPQTVYYSAKLYHASQSCARSSFMDQETAAKGMAIASKSIYSSESAAVNAHLEEFRTKYAPPTQAVCNETRLHILERVAAGALTPAAPSVSTKPSTTNCSTYFGQTHCYSF
jgi:hypothetical protein